MRNEGGSCRSETFETRRRTMVRRQLERRGIRDGRVLAAMEEVPREVFVDAGQEGRAYADEPLPIGFEQTISQPYVVALMIEAIELQPTDVVLEVGAGSGYAAAVMSRIARAVYAIERVEKLAISARDRARRLGYDNLRIRHGDGLQGWRGEAPFDAILVSAAGSNVPESLRRQLVIGGRLVIPVAQEPHSQQLLRVTRIDTDRFQSEAFGHVCFVPLVAGVAAASDAR